jgi:hypothetical protein
VNTTTNTRSTEPTEHIDVPTGDDLYHCKHCGEEVKWDLDAMPEAQRDSVDPGPTVPAKCPNCGQNYTLTFHDEPQAPTPEVRTTREAFDAEIVPLLSLINAKAQEHNISIMALIGVQGEPTANDQREQEILCHVTPYQSGMIPAPMHECLHLLDRLTNAAANATPN